MVENPSTPQVHMKWMDNKHRCLMMLGEEMDAGFAKSHCRTAGAGPSGRHQTSFPAPALGRDKKRVEKLSSLVISGPQAATTWTDFCSKRLHLPMHFSPNRVKQFWYFGDEVAALSHPFSHSFDPGSVISSGSSALRSLPWRNPVVKNTMTPRALLQKACWISPKY